MKITKITKVAPQLVYAVQTSTETYIADGLAHHNCYNCNVNLKGNTIIYRHKMVEKYGEDETERIEMLYYDHTFKYSVLDLEELFEQLTEEIEALRRQV